MTKDLDVLLGSDDMMVILDDTVGVWPKHKANVIQMKRYLFFPGDAIKFGSEGTSYMEVGGDEDTDNGALGSALRVLQQSHGMFLLGRKWRRRQRYQGMSGNTAAERAACCTIMFTRVIPKDVDQSRHAAWVMATQLGARCVEDCRRSVTHVVTGGTTSKSAWGIKHGKHVVSIEWLYACGFAWKKVDEKEFPYVSGSGGGCGRDAPP
jgi:RNA polymerase II C-terminal domain phosphatase-like 3/4